MQSSIRLDSFDIKILRELQRNAGLTNQELAEKVGLTAAPCSRRVRLLEEQGVIIERTIRVNERIIGLNLFAMLHISMDKHIPKRFEAFEQAVKDMPEVMECYLIAGNDADYQLKIAISDMDSYHDLLLGKITRIAGVTGVKSSFILRKIIDSTALPLTYIEK